MSNTFLGEEQSANSFQKGSFFKYELKINHLNLLNKKLYTENSLLNDKIRRLEEVNSNILKEQSFEAVFIKNLKDQITALSNKKIELSKENESLLTTILLNQQLSIQAKKQAEFYVGRYEHKIIELRQNLQMKELQIQVLEDKLEKYKGLQLPMSAKNANRYTTEILKYEILIEEMIQERNNQKFKNIQQIQTVFNSLRIKEIDVKQKDKKYKSSKVINANSCTEVRPNLFSLTTQGNCLELLSNQKIQAIFLRLHLQLREVKKKYKQKTDLASQLKAKDKIMKQGYNTITKEMEKLKNQNFQLKIQLEHLDKKIKTTNQLSRVHSVGNIRKMFAKQNAESKFPSQVSIDSNLSDLKKGIKSALQSETKNDTFSGVSRNHNFEEKIQNIEGILSLNNSFELSGKKNKKQNMKSFFDDEQLSVCEQNQVDVSISLDASGLMAPQKSHYQISQHILSGLVDRKVF